MHSTTLPHKNDVSGFCKHAHPSDLRKVLEVLTVQTPSHPSRPTFNYVKAAATICWIIALGLAANAFAIYYVHQEHYLYYWDWAVYWSIYIHISTGLWHSTLPALSWIVESVRNDDYNPLPVVPLVPFAWLFGVHRQAYILAITSLYVLPSVFMIVSLAYRISKERLHRIHLPSLMLVSLCILLLPFLWAPVVRGLPDVAGVLAVGCVLHLSLARPLSEMRFKNAATVGILLCFMVLLRRWYVFWAAAFCPALATAQIIDLYDRRAFAWKNFVAIARNSAWVCGIFACSLLVSATPLVLRAIFTNYSDVYSAYRHSSSLSQAIVQCFAYFGWVTILPGIAGVVWLMSRKETRVWGTFFLIHSGLVFILFVRTQDFAFQHCYLLLPAIATSIGFFVIATMESLNSTLLRAMLAGTLTVLFLANAGSAFLPSIKPYTGTIAGVLSKNSVYPLNRNDIDEVDNLFHRLDDLEKRKPGGIYMLSSSSVLNFGIALNYCATGLQRWLFCDHFLRTSDVDKRDGFPQSFLHASYFVVATPLQYHLRSDDQRVLGVLGADVLGDHGIGASFKRLPGAFRLERGVTAWIYEKIRPFNRNDLDALTRIFAGYYPDKRSMFVVGN